MLRFLRKQSAGTLVVLRGVAHDGALLQWDVTIPELGAGDFDLSAFAHFSYVSVSRKRASKKLLEQCREHGRVGLAVCVRYWEAGNPEKQCARGVVVGHRGDYLVVQYFAGPCANRRMLLPPPPSTRIAVDEIWFYEQRQSSKRTRTDINCDRQGRPVKSVVPAVNPAHLLQSKKKCQDNPVKLCSLNCRSLRASWRRNVLAARFNQSPAILALQETRLESAPVEFTRVANVVCVPAVPTKAGTSSLQGGILVLIPKFFTPPATSFFEDRAVSIFFSGRLGLRITVLYAPQVGLGKDVVTSFWLRLHLWLKQLREADSLIPRPTINVVVGDFNADVSPSSARSSNSAMCATAFCSLSNLHRRTFQKTRPQFTYSSQASGTAICTTIDHVMIDQRFSSALQNVDVVENPIGSDHRMLKCTIRAHLARPKKNTHHTSPDWSHIQTDNNFAQRVLESIDVSLSGPRFIEGVAACAGLGLNQVFSSYSHFAAAVRLHAPRVEKPLAVSWPPKQMPVVVKSLADVQRAKEVTAQDATEVCQRFVELSRDAPAKAWKELHSLISSRIKSTPTKSTREEIVSHFKKVNGLQKPFSRGPFPTKIGAFGLVSDKDFTPKELHVAISQLKSGKACGLDEVPSEVLKTPAFFNLILRFSNDYLQGHIPPEVLVTRLSLVPKKGDLSIVANYRGVAITSAFLKLINLLLLNRLRVLDHLLRVGQNGFRPARGTSSHVVALRLLAELSPAHLHAVLFIDFAKAFDSVSFAAIEAALVAFCLPHRLMSAVLACYRNHSVWVESGQYSLRSGVLQGDTLAPYLFILILDLLLEEAVPRHLQVPLCRTVSPPPPSSSRYAFRPRKDTSPKLAEMSYADDVALPTVSTSHAQQLLHNIQRLSAEIGLEINVAPQKTELLLRQGATDDTIVDLQQRVIPVTHDYKYLGGRPFNPEKGLSERIGLCWCALRKLTPIWRSHCALHLKLSLLRSLVTSILLYCCEMWSPKIGTLADRAFAVMLRYVMSSSLSTSSPFFQAEVDLFASTKLAHISSIAVERQLLLIGHALRSNCVLNSVLHHQLPVDLRKATLHRTLRQRIPYPVEDWDILAHDRAGWKQLAAHAAFTHEEKVQRALLQKRRTRWLSIPRVTNRIFILLAEDFQYHNFFASKAKVGHQLKPYSMHAHFNIFASTLQRK